MRQVKSYIQSLRNSLGYFSPEQWRSRRPRARGERRDNSIPAMVQVLDQRVLPTAVWVASTQNGTEGSQDGTITLQRDDTAGMLNVMYSVDTAGSTAQSGSDYAALWGNAMFADGASTAVINVNLMDDSLVENPETLTIHLTPPGPPPMGGYTLGSATSGTITINDNDVASTVTIQAVDADASENGPNTGTFRVSRTNSDGWLTVMYSVDPSSTASENIDYSWLNSSVTFAHGESYKDIVVTPINDTMPEALEALKVNLNPGMPFGMQNYYLLGTPSSATINFADDDVATVNLTAFDPVASEGGANGTGTFRFTRDNANGMTYVNYVVSYLSTAMTGADYQTLSDWVMFSPGEYTKDVLVTPFNDTLAEDSEFVRIDLGTPMPLGMGGFFIAGSNTTASVTIEDDDASTVNITAIDADAAEVEGNAGTYRISRTNAIDSLTVNYAFDDANSTATTADFQSLEGSVTFAMGESFKDITLTATNDSLPEGPETVAVKLLPSSFPPPMGSFYILGSNNLATVTIADDDAQIITIAATDVNAGEAGPDTGTYTVTRSSATGSLTVNYAFDAANSTAGTSDFQSLGSSLTFANGETSKTITLTPVDDSQDDDDETVAVKLAGSNFAAGTAGYYILGTAQSAAVTITDDETPPVITPLQISFSIPHDQTLTVTSPIVSGTDPDGDPMTLQLVGDVMHGTLTLNANATFTYVPSANYFGADSFQVKYVDSDGLASGVVTVEIEVTNAAPVLSNVPMAVSVAEDAAVGTTLFTAQASDADDTAFTYAIVGGNGLGHFSIDGNGNVKTAQPLNYEAVWQYQLVIQATDLLGASGTSTVTVNVTDVDEPPVLEDFAVTTEDGAVFSFTGRVIDDLPAGRYVKFGGILAGHQFACGNGGYFTYTVTLNNLRGLVVATGYDSADQASPDEFLFL